VYGLLELILYILSSFIVGSQLVVCIGLSCPSVKRSLCIATTLLHVELTLRLKMKPSPILAYQIETMTMAFDSYSYYLLLTRGSHLCVAGRIVEVFARF